MIRITKQLDELDIAAANLLMEIRAQTISGEALTGVYVTLKMQTEQLRAIDEQLSKTD